MLAQVCCVLCGDTFEMVRRRGGQRKYCLTCQPEGMSVVTRRSGRVKLRRRVPMLTRTELELVWRGRRGSDAA
jgi:hypothetical protein